MADFPQRAHKLLRKVPVQYKDGKKTAVELVSGIVGRGSKASKELQELKTLVDELLRLQEEFVQTYDKSCNRSMEQFMLMVHDLSRTQGMITSLKQKIVRLCGAMGSHASDLHNFYKKKQRNLYLLQVLKAVKTIATMESNRLALLKQGEYYQSTELLSTCQILFEQWPRSREEGKPSRTDLDTVYSQLINLLSKEKINSHIAAVEAVLVDNVLRRNRLADQRIFAAIMEGDELPTDGVPVRTQMLRIAIKCTSDQASFEQVPLHEGVQVFSDDAPLVSCLPYAFLNGIVLRTSYVLPPRVSTSFTATVRTTAYVGFKGTYSDEEGALNHWAPADVPFSTIGDSKNHGVEGADQKWTFYKQFVEAKAHCTFPASIEGMPMVMIVVPQIADPAERQRAECLSAFHLLGNVGTPKPSEDQRLLEVVGRMLQSSYLSQHHLAYIEAFIKAFNTWRTQNMAQQGDGTMILSGLRDITYIKAAANTSDGAISSLDSFAYERRMASVQQPLLQQFIEALTNELLEVLRNYVDLTKKTFERIYPCYVDGANWDMSRCMLGEQELSTIAKDLVACTESAPEQDSDSLPAMEIAKRVTRMLEGSRPWGLEYLVGPRKVQGWLGMTNSSCAFREVKRQSLDENMGLELEPNLKLLQVRAGSPAHAAGLSRFVGYKVIGAKLPGHSERIDIDTVAEFNELIKCQLVMVICFEREMCPPKVGFEMVKWHIGEACLVAGAGCAEEHVRSAQEALQMKAEEAVKEIIIRHVGKYLGCLDACWECLQIKLSPVLEALCKEADPDWGKSFTSPTVPKSKAQEGSKKDELSLEKLLESRFGNDKLPRLLDNMPHVSFSFRAMDPPSDEPGSETEPILKHFMATPFNAVFLYRAVVQFTSNASRLIYNRPQGTTNILIKSLELLVTKELFPKVKAYYFKKIDEAMESASPTHVSHEVGADEVPVLEAFLVAGHALQTFAEMQEAVPVNPATRMIRSYVESVLNKVITKSLEQLEEKTKNASCGQIGLPMVKKILQSLDEEDDFKAESIVGTYKRIWRTMSMPQESQVTKETLAFLEQQQGRSGSRVHGILNRSVDISYVVCLAHSLEWLADQVMLHWGQAGRSEFTMSEKIFRAKTACYNTVVPGVEYDEDASLSEGSPREGEPFVSVEHPPDRSNPATDTLWRKLIGLSRGAFFILMFDLFTRTYTLLDARDASYDQEYDTAEPDEMIAIFTRDVRRMHVTYTHYLPPLKQQYLMQALPVAAATYLIKNISNLKQKYVTKAGVARLQRNVFALQQNLALIVTEVTISDYQLNRVKSYYDLLTVWYEDLLQMREELVPAEYSELEYEAALAVVYTAWSRQGGTA